MATTRQSGPLQGPLQELERLVHMLGGLELSLEGNQQPRACELLARLGSAGGHLRAARSALAGVPTPERSAPPEHLQGSGRTVPIQDLMCFLATQRKSGVLRVEAESERFLIQLQDGVLVYGTGDAPPSGEGLGDLLSAMGVPSTELIGRIPETGERGLWTDPNLVGTSWIPRDTLTLAIRQQTRLALFRLCAARHTHFQFYDRAEIKHVVPVRQNAMELMLEHSRLQDESRRREPHVRSAPRLGGAPAPLLRQPG